MIVKPTIDDIVARCSKFSGFNLEWELVVGVCPRTGITVNSPKLIIWDPKNPGGSMLSLNLLMPGVLHEVYGRLRHWAITREEQAVLAEALLPTVKQQAEPISPFGVEL